MFDLFSALLNEKQEKYYGFEAKKLEKQRVIDAEGNDELWSIIESCLIKENISVKEEINKQLTIANIRLSILTLWQYVSSRKVMLPGDRKVEETISKDKPPSLEEQLASVQAHIEDLHVRYFKVTYQTFLFQTYICSTFTFWIRLSLIGFLKLLTWLHTMDLYAQNFQN